MPNRPPTFTSEDWDYMMKTNPKFRSAYDEFLEFNHINPSLAKKIEKRLRELINLQTDENKTTEGI